MLMTKKILIILLSIFGTMTLANAQYVVGFLPQQDTLLPFSSVVELDEQDSTPKFVLDKKTLYIEQLDKGVQVEIYSVLGAKVFSFVYSGSSVQLNLNKGIYIVRAGKYSQKIIL